MLRTPAPLARLVALLLVASWLLGTAPALAAAPEMLPGDKVVIYDAAVAGEGYVAPPATLAAGLAGAQFEVSYSNFPPEAQAAVQQAVDIWQSLLVSPVPVRVSASWESLRDGELGAAGPSRYLRNFAGAPYADTSYPSALADAIAGRDLAPGRPDIEMLINSSNTNWYFGTDRTPAGRSNLVSVVLHELGHGLGFSGSAAFINGRATFSGNTPRPFDHFVTTGGGARLLDADQFPPASPQLAAALQGGDLYFDGPNARAANGDTPPKLYAPSTWQQGSSYSHLDERSYPSGTANALMTPSLARGEANYQPGPIALGILADLGWPLAPGAVPDLPDTAASILPSILDLGDVALGASSATRVVTLRNAGAAPLTLVGARNFGPRGEGFATVNQTCTAAPIAPGSACALALNFTPARAGAASLTWELAGPGGEPLATLTLRGNGLGAGSSAVGGPDDERCMARAGRCKPRIGILPPAR